MDKKQSELEMEFYKKGIEFLYKQAPVIVVCFLFCAVMGYALKVLWEKNEQTYAALESRYMAVESKIETYQDDLKMCESKREELAKEVAALTVKVTFLQSRR